MSHIAFLNLFMRKMMMKAFANIAKVRLTVVDFPMKVSVMWQHFQKSHCTFREKKEKKSFRAATFCHCPSWFENVYIHVPHGQQKNRPGKGKMREIRENKTL